jgi:hypothetical protein
MSVGKFGKVSNKECCLWINLAWIMDKEFSLLMKVGGCKLNEMATNYNSILSSHDVSKIFKSNKIYTPCIYYFHIHARVVCASVRPSCPSVCPSRPIRFMSVR